MQQPPAPPTLLLFYRYSVLFTFLKRNDPMCKALSFASLLQNCRKKLGIRFLCEHTACALITLIYIIITVAYLSISVIVVRIGLVKGPLMEIKYILFNNSIQ